MSTLKAIQKHEKAVKAVCRLWVREHGSSELSMVYTQTGNILHLSNGRMVNIHNVEFPRFHVEA
jgi:hypothetical protein